MLKVKYHVDNCFVSKNNNFFPEKTVELQQCSAEILNYSDSNDDSVSRYSVRYISAPVSQRTNH